MATKPDWAMKKAFKAADIMGDVNERIVAKMLKQERRRAVRIVEKVKGYHQGAIMRQADDGKWVRRADIIAALKGNK